MIQPVATSLYKRLELFGEELTTEQKGQLCYAALFNNLRLIEDREDERHRLIGKLVTPASPESCHLPLSFNGENWRELLNGLHWTIRSTPGSKPLERSLLLGRKMARAGLCPILHYAFDQWYDLPDFNDSERLIQLDRLVDLSTTFLYRLIELPQTNAIGRKIGSGAYTDVYQIAHDMVDKVPRNFASKRFASQDEFFASLYAESSLLAPHVPRLVAYDPDSGIIRREYIDGQAALELLDDPTFVTRPFGVAQLREIYSCATEIYRKDGINFDIHPGNFRWDNARNKWFLVDLGPMPSIGADYFPRDDFEAYMKKIWFDLARLMVEVPIRSVDLGTSHVMAPKNFFSTFIHI